MNDDSEWRMRKMFTVFRVLVHRQCELKSCGFCSDRERSRKCRNDFSFVETLTLPFSTAFYIRNVTLRLLGTLRALRGICWDYFMARRHPLAYPDSHGIVFILRCIFVVEHTRKCVCTLNTQKYLFNNDAMAHYSCSISNGLKMAPIFG